MSLYVNNTFRIRRNAEQQEAMHRLIDAKIFDAYKDILMISAIIGYNRNCYVEVQKAASDGVLMQFFSQKDYDIMDLIAYAHTKEQGIVKEDRKYSIFSAYANGGFPILLKMLEIDPTQEITPEAAKKAMKKYYRLLLTNGFGTSEIETDDLFI